jgi:cation transport protein ChaC
VDYFKGLFSGEFRTLTGDGIVFTIPQDHFTGRRNCGMTPADQMDLTEELVQRCHRTIVEEVVDEKYDYFRDEDYPPIATALLAKRPPGPFWIFAYGSLIWKRDFEIVEQRHGTAMDWHRSFCLRLTNWRGTPDQPGLMMALDRGGRCEGLLLQLPPGEEEKILHGLLWREVGSHEQMESTRWISVQAADGIIEALTFYAGPDNLHHYVGSVSLPEAAHVLARSCGSWGSGAEYLYNTVKHLEEAGIRDDNLWQLQRLTAEEIQKL